MVVSDLITRVREDYLDDTLGVNNNDSLVSEAALIRFADEAQDQACRRGDMIYDESDATIRQIQLIDGVRGYKLNQKITVLERVLIDNVGLKHTTESGMDSNVPGWRAAAKGPPTHYYIRQRTLYVDPVPDVSAAAKTLDLSVYRKPKTALTAIGDSFEIFEEAQDDLVYWMLYRVYNLRDEDLNDPTAAKMYYRLFEKSYGEEVPLRTRIHQFENPRLLQNYLNDNYSISSISPRHDDDFDSRGWS